MPPDHLRPDAEVAVAISGSASSDAVLKEAIELKRRLSTGWIAVHVETPRRGTTNEAARAAHLLSAAARAGAEVAVVPAATVADGLLATFEDTPAKFVVLGRSAARLGFRVKSPVSERLQAERRDLCVVIVADAGSERARELPSLPSTSWKGILFAGVAVLLTSITALLLGWSFALKSLGLLFLIPVLTAAARHGLASAVAAALLSIFTYDVLFLEPRFSFRASAPQMWLMTLVLVPVAIYTSLLTSQLRGRLRLSERSAAQSSGLAALAVDLTRASSRTETAEIICAHVRRLFDVQVTVLRVFDGEPKVEGADPSAPRLDPVDRVALEWCWSHAEVSGSGSNVMSAANWQFHPLATSLGMLAVLGIAKEDGSSPLRADQQLLFSTVVAQAALAHERLELEGRVANCSGRDRKGS